MDKDLLIPCKNYVKCTIEDVVSMPPLAVWYDGMFTYQG